VLVPVFYVLVERMRGLTGRLVTLPEETAAAIRPNPLSVNGDGAMKPLPDTARL